MVAIKGHFRGYRVELEICEGAPCIEVKGGNGGIEINGNENTRKIGGITSYKCCGDIVGNRFGEFFQRLAETRHGVSPSGISG